MFSLILCIFLYHLETVSVYLENDVRKTEKSDNYNFGTILTGLLYAF